METTKPSQKSIKDFYFLLGNTMLANLINMTVWFALVFFVYLETKAVIVTSVTSGIFLATVAITGFWFGTLVDHYKKKSLMLISSIFSLISYIIGLVVYLGTPDDAFKDLTNPTLWIFIIILLAGVIAGNIRTIAIPTLVTLMIPEDRRDRANGLVGTSSGIVFLVVSVISGLLVAHSGMYLALVLAIIVSILSIAHLVFIPIKETVTNVIKKGKSKLDIRGTLKIISSVPGLASLIVFTTLNNFLGGVYMSLMDAYGLSLVSVQVWGFIWGFLSTAFIVGGLVIAKKGLGKNPLKSLFIANIIIWSVSTVFTIQPSIVLLMIGMFIYLAVVPFIEASEHTIIQKVVSADRQGRVFGIAQSIEQTASPLTSFLIGPLAQFFFIPFMTNGDGARLIGKWYGTGADRGISLVFTLTGIIGLAMTIIAFRSKFYKRLSERYLAG
ncbi:MAG TPA: MFS transporter [Candidatus Dojkabacteria bacterium]|nr:MFS transporter [Candidatus Dojkabacteria bacterium]HRP50892.1 MFS transporter [Candidatus Dojkabacteria bacterium]